MRGLLVLAATAALAACNQTVAKVDEPAPADYRKIVADYVRSSFFDPYTVRDASISAPRPGSVYVPGTLGVHEQGWAVCLRANARNRMGGYTGRKDTLIVIRAGAVVGSNSDNKHHEVYSFCDKAIFEPFPEIEEATVANPRRQSSVR